MKRYVNPILASVVLSGSLLFIPCDCCIQAVEPSSQKIASFAFNNIPLATSLSVFQRRYPSVPPNRDPADAKIGVKSYTIVGTKGADGAVLSFYNDKLYKVEVFYFAKRVNEMGGLDALTKRIVATFGRPSRVDRQEKVDRLFWDVPDVNRRAEFAILGADTALTVVDTMVEENVSQQKAKTADLGF